MDHPHTAATWRVEGFEGFNSLNFEKYAPVQEVGQHDCLVRIEAVSLNHRDLMILKGTYPFPLKKRAVPGSDGAGVITAIGKRVTRFKKGDNTSLGGSLDGTLRQYGVFVESGLVHMPKTLSFNEVSTLPCAAVTAWNVLCGLQGRSLKPGDMVLTQGVSTFALQFAVAVGATMIPTTSSAEKERKLKILEAHQVITYTKDTKWGETAKKLTPGAEGVDFVVEVGGPTTLKQSLATIKVDGIITIVGAIGGQLEGQQEPGLLDACYSTCTVRGLAVGSRAQFEEMNRAVEANGLKPVLYEKVFKLEQLKDACQRMWDQKNSGIVVIKCH